ncbi:MAG: acyl-CoA/acyl-ACP dehydrogenase, partial [Acidimicrobiales bacterium]|nr:acyl-CoA/acyl-ACP dehydrogenase [Acidimicrobiales bacterium]
LAHQREAIASGANPDDRQTTLYELSHAAAAVSMTKSALNYAEHGPAEEHLALVFIGSVLSDLGATLWGAAERWGVDPASLEPIRAFAAAASGGDFAGAAFDEPGSTHLAEEFDMVADTFRRFGADKIAPQAEAIHRHDLDIPRDIIDGVAELGCFGLSIPEQYGGFATGSEGDYMAMVIATEELSRASLGAGGSLITRPEILARALENGGTEEQKQHWLPRISSGETLCAVAVTEPDFGSDVAGLKVTATATEGGWLLNGVKTWCTFAGRANALMVLARTDPDPAARHRGLSILIVEKPSDDGHEFRHTSESASGTGTLEGRAIPTLGYRGMHSYEVSFDDWFVPADNLIGGDDGQGRGFYLQMAGFENGRIQTAARAVGLMQRAYEVGLEYAANRAVFGATLDQYQLTKAKLGKMAAIIAISRQYTYDVAKLMAGGDGALEAAMAKAYVCRQAEWVTRESLQIHGGMGYAEEYEISRLFVDARVLSIFEGADETLCLKLIARRLLG